jgi:hypothetical protein
MTVDEMLGRGMEINQAGYWIKEKSNREFKR